MKRTNNTIVFAWGKEGKVYFKKDDFKKYTNERSEATVMPYDQAWSLAKKNGWYVESR